MGPEQNQRNDYGVKFSFSLFYEKYYYYNIFNLILFLICEPIWAGVYHYQSLKNVQMVWQKR